MRTNVLKRILAAIVAVLTVILVFKIATDLSSKTNEQITEVNDAVENCALDSDESLGAIDERLEISNDDQPPPPPPPPPSPHGEPPNCGGAVTAADLKKCSETSCKNYELNMAITMQAKVSVTDCAETVHDIPISAQLNCVGSFTVWPGFEGYMQSSNSGSTQNVFITMTANNAISGHISIGGGSIIDCEDIPVCGQLNYFSLISACRAGDGAVLSSNSISNRNKPTILETNSIHSGYMSMVERDAPVFRAVDCKKMSMYKQSNCVSLIDECYTNLDPAMSSNSGSAGNQPIFITGSCSADYVTVCEKPPYMQENPEGSINTLYVNGGPAMSSGGASAGNQPIFITGSCSADYYATVCEKSEHTQ